MNSPIGSHDEPGSDPDPIKANDRSFIESHTSDWMSEEDAAPEGYQGIPDANEQATGEKQSLISIRVLGGMLLLVFVAILGNLAVPATLDHLLRERGTPPPRPFPDGSVTEWASYYCNAIFRVAFFGLWFAEYVALWLWINSYVPSRTTRWLLGLFACAAISYTVVLGMSIAWGPAPADFFWFCMIGSFGLYTIINLLLKLLLRRSHFHWKPIQLGTGNRYSIRVLLGTMIGSAVLMLGLKLFPYDWSGVAAKSAMDFVPLAIWLSWVAIAIATLIWLQLGSIFSPRRGRFLLCFFALAIFGPIVFHLIGACLLAWHPATRFTIDFEQFVIVYSIEVGLVAGVALMLPLLPQRAVESTEPRAES